MTDIRFQLGQQVKHPEFGEGMVVRLAAVGALCVRDGLDRIVFRLRWKSSRPCPFSPINHSADDY
jgi:hypothetical protein